MFLHKIKIESTITIFIFVYQHKFFVNLMYGQFNFETNTFKKDIQ